jgi:hypothetical protein
MHKQFRVIVLPFQLVFLAASTAWCSTPPVIYSTGIDSATNQITISGNAFSPAGAAPTVILDNSQLTLVSFTDQSIMANLPSNLSAGSYRLSVTNSSSQTVTLTVTIGAVGPPGPAGPPGPTGPPGPPGVGIAFPGGISNTAVGLDALPSNTANSYNTAVGFNALRSNTIGVGNTAVGAYCLQANTDGVDNTAIGVTALQRNTTGGFNTALGYQALNVNTVGADNTAVGANTLQNNLSSYNTAYGSGALYLNTYGNYNTAIGVDALYSNTYGSYNIAIGYNAGLLNPADVLYNIDIGSMGSPTDSYTTRIGDVQQERFFAGGIRGITTGNNDAVPVVIDSAGQLGTVNSSGRFKEDIQDMGSASRD